MKNRENFESIIVNATITATSNKTDGKYKQKKQTKTLYIVPSSKDESKKLIDFGLTEYTPDTEKDPQAKPYFIVKATELVKLYTSKDEFSEIFFGVETREVLEETGEIKVKKAPNFMTQEPVYISIMFVKGGDNGNDFFRANAIMAKSEEVLEKIEQINPFAELFDK